MRTKHVWLAGWVGLAVVAPGPEAAAQGVTFNAPGFLIKKPEQTMPEVRAAPLAWPRLDPGAVLCRTEYDLERLAARRRGEPNGPADCRIVSQPTAITIVQRRGPGKTQVQVTEAATIVGWTDVWLPEKAPPNGAGRSAAAR